MKVKLNLLYLCSILLISYAEIFGQLSGTYYIDQNASGGNLFSNGGRYFNSFGDVIDTLYSQGVSGAVIFEVSGGQLFHEQLQIDGPFTGVSPSNTITFRYIGENKPIIQPDSEAFNSLAGVIDIRFDGDYYLKFEGLKINGTYGNLTYKRGIRIIWGADNITIKDCEVYDFSSDGIVVYYGGGEGGNSLGCENDIIEGNHVYHLNLSSSDASQVNGIWINGGDSTVVRGNVISNLIPGSSVTAGIYCIGGADTNYCDIYNNFVSIGENIPEDIFLYGIFSQQIEGPVVNIYHNSVNISGMVDNSNSFTTALRLANDATTNIQNNILVNKRLKNSGTADHYSIYMGGSSTPYNCDYNDFFVTPGGNLAYYSTPRLDLQGWQSATGQDQNSISEDPLYQSTTNLHVVSSSPVSDLGNGIPEITVDIDGELRDLINPDIGADEFSSNPENIPPIALDDESSTGEDIAVDIDVLNNDYDPDGNLVPWTVVVQDQPSHGGTSVNGSTGVVTYTPAVNYYGSDSFSYTVDDNASSRSDTAIVTITILPRNDPPIITGQVSLSTPEETSLTIHLNNLSVNDPDNSYPGDFTLTVQNGSNYTRVGNTITPINNFNGDLIIPVSVNDGLNNSDIFNLSVTVTAINDIPVLSNPISDLQIDEDSELIFTFPENVFTDVDVTDNLSYSAKLSGGGELPSWLSFHPETRTFNGIPKNEDVGEMDIRVTAIDDSAASAFDEFHLEVLNVNDSPEITDILPNLFFNEDDSLSIVISDLYQYVEDPDNPDSNLIYIINSGKTVTTTLGAHSILLKSNKDWFGSDTLELKVSDGELADSAKMMINVNPVNDKPEFSDLPDTIKIIHSQDTILTMRNFVKDVDSPLNTIYWEFSVSDDTLKYEFNEETTELKISAMNYLDVFRFYLKVTDDSSASVMDSIIVEIIADVMGISDNIISGIPTTFSLDQNYPNPFNPNTKIKFGLPKACRITIQLYNILGQFVETIFNANRQPGFHVIDFNANHLPSGIYFYRIQASNFNDVKKMILLK